MARVTMWLGGALLITSVVGLFHVQARGQSAPQTVTPADYLRWRTELRNWGRWGPNDQKGTANLITPAKVQSALKLAREGVVVSLAHAVPQQEAADVGAAQVFHRTTNSISATNT